MCLHNYELKNDNNVVNNHSHYMRL